MAVQVPVAVSAGVSDQMIRVAASSLIWNHPRGAAFPSWLAEVRALGYDGVSGFCDTGWAEFIETPRQFRQTVEQHGLSVASLAGGLHADRDRHRRVANFMRETGCENIVLIGSPGDDYSDFARVADALNETAAVYAELGIKPAYHNSSKRRPMTFAEVCTVMDRASPSLVSAMCDTGHATRDFIDVLLAERPTRFLDRYWDRLSFLEFKDYALETDVNTPVGEGECPWSAVFSLLRRREFSRWIVVEQNGNLGPSRGRTPGECARVSLEFIRRELK